MRVMLKLSPGFSNEVWDFYIGFLFLVPAFLWISYRTLKYYHLTETHNFSYFINVYILFNALSQQGFEQDPSYLSTRIIFITMFLSGVVIFETFSASYTSFLSVIEMKKPFNDLAELDKSGFTIGGLDTGATKTIFQVALISLTHRRQGQLSIAERRTTEPGPGRLQVGRSGKLRWCSQEGWGRPRVGFNQPHPVHLPHHAATRRQVRHDRETNKYLYTGWINFFLYCSIDMKYKYKFSNVVFSEMGPTLFYGHLVFVWKKNFPYAPLLNYK